MANVITNYSNNIVSQFATNPNSPSLQGIQPYLATSQSPSTNTPSTSSGATSTSGNISTVSTVTIGTIPYTTSNNSGANLIPGMTESNLPELGLINVYLVPMQINFDAKSFLLYNLTPATDPTAPARVNLLVSPQLIGISESFSNTMQGSFFEMMLEKIMPITQLAQLRFPGYNDVMNSLVSLTKKGSAIVGGLTSYLSGGGQKLIEAAGNVLAQGISVWGQGSRISWPKIWNDSSMSVSYTLSVYLFCNDTGNDALYKSSIIDNLNILLQYVLPRSTGGSTYQWPWFVYAEAPGLFILPEGVITNLTVNKMDVGYNNRPSTVRVDMTISPLREAMPQNGKNNELPAVALNLNTYIENLLGSKSQASIPIITSGLPNDNTGGSTTNQTNITGGVTGLSGGVNNPGFLRSSQTSFFSYNTIQDGIKAAYNNIMTPTYNYGNMPISKIISIWAPSIDNNDTAGYIQFVSQQSGVPSNAIFSSLTPNQKVKVLTAMFNHEGNPDWKNHTAGMTYSQQVAYVGSILSL